MTIKEITDYRDSFLRKRKIRRRESADMIYRLATLITNGTSCILSSNAKAIEFLDIFGDIFEEESKINEEKKRQVQMEINKQRMKDFAERVNKQMTGGEE